jgi:hypothetical protein
MKETRRILQLKALEAGNGSLHILAQDLLALLEDAESLDFVRRNLGDKRLPRITRCVHVPSREVVAVEALELVSDSLPPAHVIMKLCASCTACITSVRLTLERPGG